MNNLQLWSAESNILSTAHFISLGLSQETADSLYAFQLVLSTIILKNTLLLGDMKILSIRKQYAERGETIDEDSTPLRYDLEKEFKIVIRGIGFVIYHADLLPLWKKFCIGLKELSTYQEDSLC